jgi:preprotein translocase subunit SecG
MYFVAVVLYVIVCLLLLVVVLLQQGKGGDIAAAFGGSSSQTAFGARTGATVLTRATTILGALFMVGAFSLGVMSRGGGSSVVSGIDAPPPAATSVPQLPMTTAAAHANDHGHAGTDGHSGARCDSGDDAREAAGSDAEPGARQRKLGRLRLTAYGLRLTA